MHSTEHELGAFAMATVSTIGFVGGGVLLAVGTTLFAVGATSSGDTDVSVGPGGMRLRGRF